MTGGSGGIDLLELAIVGIGVDVTELGGPRSVFYLEIRICALTILTFSDIELCFPDFSVLVTVVSDALD